MTNSIYFGKMELDFTHPLSEDIVKYASPKIQANLTRVMEAWYDEETRLNDPRRTHLPLYRTVFRTTYEKDGIKITNELPYGGEAPQFSYLYYGNTGRPICTKGFTRHILKGYSANDRHKTVLRDGVRYKRPEAGDLGVERPRVLKFWSKRDNMWIYRRCVKPIGTGIIISFQQAIKQAVNQALEDASWEASYESDIDEEMGTSDDSSAVTPTGEGEDFFTVEDLVVGDYGTIHTEKEKEEVENQLRTMASRSGQELEKKLRWMQVTSSKAIQAKAFKPEVQPAPKTGIWASVKHFGVSTAHQIKSFLWGE